MELKVVERIEGVSSFSRKAIESLNGERKWGIYTEHSMKVAYIPTGTMLYRIIDGKLTQVCVKEVHYSADEDNDAHTTVVVETPSGEKWRIPIQGKYVPCKAAFFESKEQYLRYAMGDSDAYYHISEKEITRLIDFSHQPTFNFDRYALTYRCYGASYAYSWKDGQIKMGTIPFGRIVIVGDTAYGEIAPHASDIYLDKNNIIKDKLGNMEVEEFSDTPKTFRIEVKIEGISTPIVSKLME